MASFGSSTTKICARVHQQLLACQFKNKSLPVKKKFSILQTSSYLHSRIFNSQNLSAHETEESPEQSKESSRVSINNNTIGSLIIDNNSCFSNSSSIASPLVRLYESRFRDNSNVNKTSVPSSTQFLTCCYHSHISNSKWQKRHQPQRQQLGAGGIRHMSSMRSTQQPISLPEYQVNPYRLIDDDLKEVYDDIRLLIRKNTNNAELHAIGTYYFDGQGKAFRPMVITLMARALNHHMNKDKNFLQSQREVAMIAEMIHIASLIHDDVIDQAELRRGKPSANVLWNQKKVAMAGDFILAVASMMIARLKNDEVTLVLSEVITDLVQGEFMQLGSKETENERFAHYLTKTYRKTASLIANSLKSVAILAAGDEQMCELAYQYGRNLGLAFQLVDDLLDFVSSAEEMGKPTAADLKLGLATAPVLFACEKYPELTPMIMRRFAEPGDCERAFELVHQSQGLKQTQFLAQQHCMEASRLANTMAPSPHQKALVVLTDLVLNRMK